jgi:hypothetical protein
MKKKSLFYLFIICLFLFIEEVHAKTIHAIFVADTVNDTGFETKPDMQSIQNDLRAFSKHTQIPLKERIFLGSGFKKSTVETYLNQLKVDSSDTVIFYFSGHGYRTQEMVSPWPFLTFEFYKPGIDLKWVTDTIRKKSPQFSLIMADCCNNFIERGFINETKYIRINLHDQPSHYPGYRQLFLNAKGCIVLCSSSKGQFSYGSRLGGLFTQCFMNSLKQESHKTTPSWKRLLERASSYIKHIQKPVCEVYH